MNMARYERLIEIRRRIAAINSELNALFATGITSKQLECELSNLTAAEDLLVAAELNEQELIKVGKQMKES